MEMQDRKFSEDSHFPFFKFTNEEKFNFWEEDYKLLSSKEDESDFESPQEFLKYLDTNLKAEINLTESDQLSTFINFKYPEISLKYRGQKHNFDRGANAERKDILCKNLLRALRRYLWELFQKENNISTFSRNDPLRTFNKAV
jgi:hypothetical protein